MNHRATRDQITENLAERDRNAVWTVAAHALDRDDCAELLAMLGLDPAISIRCPRCGSALPGMPNSSPPITRTGPPDTWRGCAR